MKTENFTEYKTYLRFALNSGSTNPDLVGMLYYKFFDFAETPIIFTPKNCSELFEVDDLHRNLFDQNEQLIEKYRPEHTSSKYIEVLECFHDKLGTNTLFTSSPNKK